MTTSLKNRKLHIKERLNNWRYIPNVLKIYSIIIQERKILESQDFFIGSVPVFNSNSLSLSLSLSPCRFILASIYTAYSTVHTVINILALLLGVVPKLPMLHGFRLFGINKY